MRRGAKIFRKDVARTFRNRRAIYVIRKRRIQDMVAKILGESGHNGLYILMTILLITIGCHSEYVKKNNLLRQVTNESDSEEERINALNSLIKLSNYERVDSNYGIDHKLIKVAFIETNTGMLRIDATLNLRPEIVDERVNEKYYALYTIILSKGGDVVAIKAYSHEEMRFIWKPL